ncbi:MULTISPECIES: phospholipid-binding protein MlaC [unclassified Colwellia]|uniref:MlaC/ttg2D family ABC transporter substrate-binding protein n=1 Tax=unclassified Colwellia TaxID=196834 RepID=UPI0015F356D7|nr:MULTISPECIES: ABC transporter substrate-binding protein [unclassified Colwellia]MBA6224917.1 ABC transporter substrate-binding protein [Colwellia sp. MB3u-45]MBA6268795.1 ABC transporter substrate-binding protein [Colwellia sp. MB3u-43]MBA6287459.1 ABC transporter substrate-binding protein [Colwellia sp. MB3u-4]MBA6321226.1 ABC transporter substrate-binding protein [Colwellia sp. MB02u-19]MBA6325779.1 ABC transporter substrate-binding protein [Colwellia sp. MB02u-18]
MTTKRTYNTNLISVVIFTMALLITATVFASPDDAKAKVKQIFSQVEASLIKLKQTETLTKANIKDVLNKYLLPEVDTRYFTYKILNKNFTKVPEELREPFIAELSLQLINTYSNLLNKYDNEVINIGESTISKSGKMAMVDITIVGSTKTNKAVVKLLQSSTQAWLFFDIEVEGISLLQTKQAEINASFNKLGIEGTLLQLQKINHKVVEG